MKLSLNLNLLSLVFACLVGLSAGALGQDYPSKPVKIVVGYVPGGSPDFTARMLAQYLPEYLGQPVVIDNRPGAGGTLATAQVAKAPADGYTLLMGESGQLVIAPHLFKDLHYDPVKDLTPIALATTEPLVLVSNAKTTNIRTIQDLIREAKANPGKLNYGSSGLGSIHHIAMEVFNNEAGINITHVPYKGTGQSVPALLGGDVQLLITSFTGVWSHVQAGTVNLLAVSSGGRFPDVPNTPSLSDVVPGYDYPVQIGLLGPAGLPPEVVTKLSNAIKAVLQKPELLKKLKFRSQMTWTTPEEYREIIRQNLRKYERAVKLANVPSS